MPWSLCSECKNCDGGAGRLMLVVLFLHLHRRESVEELSWATVTGGIKILNSVLLLLLFNINWAVIIY